MLFFEGDLVSTMLVRALPIFTKQNYAGDSAVSKKTKSTWKVFIRKDQVMHVRTYPHADADAGAADCDVVRVTNSSMRGEQTTAMSASHSAATRDRQT